jgi:hypothetical protein
VDPAVWFVGAFITNLGVIVAWRLFRDLTKD